MSQYIILSHINVQNANTIAGLTWGFPAITHFLGFTHALSRKLTDTHNLQLEGCAVVSHQVQNKVYQPSKYADYEFLQSKNPPVLAKHKSDSPPIIEEGKMNLTVSLILAVKNTLAISNEEVARLETHIHDACCQMRLAGGTVLSIKKLKFVSASTEEENKKALHIIKRLTMPGFVLIDRSPYLQNHFEDIKHQAYSAQLLDAWLDFIALRYQAVSKLDDDNQVLDESTPAEWEYQPKPQGGYLVPLMVGYKAISKRYAPNELLNTRDTEMSTRFVEPIHSIGEWKSIHRIVSASDAIWCYQYDDPWYLCTQYKQPTAMDILDNTLPSTKKSNYSELTPYGL